MHFSLTAKPPKPKPKKAKDKVVVMRTGRGGGGNIKRRTVPKTPPSADLASITSGVAISPSPAPQTDAGSSQLSRIASGITHTSKTGSSNSTPDMGEAEDKIKAPAGREILSAKHRKIYSGRGGAGNAHKLLADDSVYERVLLHEQGIVQAYNEERKGFEARSSGRGGSGNIRKKRSAGGSDTSSTRTRSSGRSWGSIARRYKNAQGTTTQSSLSLSPIPSLQALPNNDFGSSLEKGIFEQAIFERVSEEDDPPVAGPSTSQAHPSTAREGQKPIKVIVSTDMDIAISSRAANDTTSPTGAAKPALWLRTPASKPISPSAIASGSWIANRLQEATSIGVLSRSRPPNVPPPPIPLSSGSSSSSLAGRGKSVPPNTRLSHNATPSPLSSSPPVLDITISPSTTPTSNVMNMRRAASSNALNSAMEMSDEQMTTVRPRQNPTMSNQANRNVSVYKSHDSLSSSASEDALALYRAYSQESLDSTLPYLNSPSSSTPRAPSTMKHLAAQRPSSRPLPSSPSASKTLELPHTAADAIRHSRHMSSSDTSGSELDLARYNFPDAPGHQPRVIPRDVEPASLHMLVEERSAEGMMLRYRSEPVNAPTPQSHSPPPRTSSRAPVQPGAYQAALRSVMDDVPDGPPPLYQPRASRKYSVDPSQDQYYPESPTPTSYSPQRIASPSNASVRSNPDTSPTILRPSLRPAPSASPLSEVHTPVDGSPLEKYPSEPRMNEKAYPSEKSPPIITRSGAGRRPSDPYQRLLSTAGKNSPPHTPTRRGSSPYVQQQTLSPHMAAHPHASHGEHVESPTEYSDSRSRPPSQAFSTYTRGTRHSTWGASQATATAIDHHDADFPNIEDDGLYYSSMFGDIDGYENERVRAYREALVAKGMRLNGKEPDWLHPNFAPPLPEIPKHLLAERNSGVLEPAASRSPSRQLPTPPIGPPGTPPPAPHPYFPGGMGWDELNRPPPRKLSKMEKALLRRVEFGAGAAADIASIPLA